MAPAVSVLQLLKFGTLSLRLFQCVPAMIPFAINSRPTTSSWPSNPLSASSLEPQIRLWLTIVRVYKLYLLTYLLIYTAHLCMSSIILIPSVWLGHILSASPVQQAYSLLTASCCTRSVFSALPRGWCWGSVSSQCCQCFHLSMFSPRSPSVFSNSSNITCLLYSTHI